MKIIDRNGRLFGKISVIDVLVILVVIAMGAAMYMRSSDQEITNTVSNNVPITYQVMVRGVRNYIGDSIRVGDMVYESDNAGGAALGEIIAIDEQPGSKLAEMHDGTVIYAPIEDSVNLLLTIRGEGIIADGRHLINRVFDVGLNSSRSYNTKYCQFTCTVVDIL